MSRAVLIGILLEMRVLLSEPEVEELYRELLTYFGLVGALYECQALEYAWKDPYNRREIEGFIKEWLRRRRRREEAIAGVV
ncbi:MAG: hypothetical protein QXU47_04175 [Candidatus Bathyarchaeia archaeon]